MYYRDLVTIAVCPGTFDPITLGHLDVIERASTMFAQVVVGVARNSSKAPLLDLRLRVQLAQASVAHLPNVSVAPVPGLLVDFCRDVGATVIIKGIRGGSDYDGEMPMALMNRALTQVETVFLPASQEVAHVASSLVKDVMRFGGDVTDMVSPQVWQAMDEALAAKGMYLAESPAPGHVHNTTEQPPTQPHLRLIDSHLDDGPPKEHND